MEVHSNCSANVRPVEVHLVSVTPPVVDPLEAHSEGGAILVVPMMVVPSKIINPQSPQVVEPMKVHSECVTPPVVQPMEVHSEGGVTFAVPVKNSPSHKTVTVEPLEVH